MTLRQTVYVLVAVNAILFIVGVLLYPVLLQVQGFVSIVALVLLAYWVAQLENDVDKPKN
jgi:membrane protein implicated in regulation of membrane protease activity